MKKIIGLALAISLLAAGSITTYAVTGEAYCHEYGVCTEDGDCTYSQCLNGEDCSDEDCPVHRSSGRGEYRGHHSQSQSHHRSGSGHRRGGCRGAV